MKIENNLLKKLEKLSSLEIGDDKRDDMITQLSEIVKFIENLNELDLDKEEATFTTLQGGTPMRKDIPKVDSKIIKTILKNAPQSKNGSFVVPKIID
ncbi:MAG: Asp-tRNA(Asn)/Glu-tRNA(Gln) amidotransferase subunit GatC [Sulfurospirillum sp.]|nr:Asp-tRNA(Asn)/Glu-tRNA(Gln) amidotransferase subunit GatC [Sulfurospirillum sp.]MBL0702626.1 Asp-tRNA(Asn)/Glu-tRNA(Gln) amidotransferase subunit GatC [Sulfurospirillum sp.]